MSTTTSTTDPTDIHLQSLRTALENVKAPYCSGTLDVDETSLLLFYGNTQGQTGRINMFRASEAELMCLSEACDPATFGLNQEDVLDPSYRKALKLDHQYFATKLDIASAGLMDVVRYGLLEGKKGARPFSAELYKLNVYDKDSFFKAHKDTPRGKRMFGTLVVVFPTTHEGGALLLRHGDKELSFDSGRVIAEKRNSNAEQPCIAFATFFSDVEHEVTPVISGYRVTLTYNLYFETSSTTEIDRPLQVTAQTIPRDADTFKAALSSLLAEPSFLPEGGSIGFGLYHQYPIVQSSGRIDGLDEYLKGRDAMIKEACTDLALNANLWVLYDDKAAKAQILAKNALNVASVDDMSFSWTLLWMNYDVRVAKRDEEDSKRDKTWDRRPLCNIVWVNKLSKLNTISTTYAAYGNESYLDCTYANVCLIVDIGPPGDRSKKPESLEK